MNHIPVLLDEILSQVSASSDGWAVDCTVGGGGHFFALLKEEKRIIGFDADILAIKHAHEKLIDLGFKLIENPEGICTSFLNPQNGLKVVLCNCNFTNAKEYLSKLKISKIKFVLADLGLSTDQLLFGGRGFSFSKPSEELDMRINTKDSGPKASDLIRFLSEGELKNMLRDYGEVYSAKIIAKKIVSYRERFGDILTVGDLLKAIGYTKKIFGVRVHPATKIFMALRIAVNSEFQNLKTLLESFEPEIQKGTKMLVISFHSLEQKIIESFVQTNSLKLLKIRPNEEEILKNPSSRSSTLNVIEIL